MTTPTYTITAAHFGNDEHSAAIMMTEEAGAVAVSEADTPELWAEMLAAVPNPTPFAPDLVTYANAKWRRVLDDGTVSVGGFQSGTDGESRAFVAGAIQLVDLDPNAQILWNGTTPISGAQLRALGAALGGFVQQAFAANGRVLAAFAAGQVTTVEQVEHPETVTIDGQPLPAWPVNS